MGTTVLYLAHRRRNHKMKLAQFVAIYCLLAVSSSVPQRRRNQNNVNTKFFTGNNAIDSAAWGAALGAGTQYFANQVLNPCRGGNRGGTRGGNQGTNTRHLLKKNLQRSSFTSTLLKSSSSVISSCSSSTSSPPAY